MPGGVPDVVDVLAVVPMMSMSAVRKVFWQVTARGCGGRSWPRKYGFSGCMPATVSSAERSWAEGTSDAEGMRR
jgi:hypothetical protein